MLFIVVIIFIILHIPFTALIFIRNQLLKSLVMDQIDGWFYILWYTSHYLLYLNAAVNPIIYGLTNDNFRRAYHQTPLLPQRIRIWSTLTKKTKNRNHNEVRIDFCAVNSHAQLLCVTVSYCICHFRSLSRSPPRSGDWVYLQAINVHGIDGHPIVCRPTQLSLVNPTTMPSCNNNKSIGKRSKM